MEQKKIRQLPMLVLAAAVVLISVLIPEQMARYKDQAMLNRITVEETEEASAGYRYTLSSNEKLFLLSRCLRNQTLPESELSSRTRVETSKMDYEELMGSYAFVVNHQGPSPKEITEEEIFEVCSREMKTLKELEVLPDSVREAEADAYDAVLYSAIDVLEPQNNLSVWKVSLSTSQQTADKTNRLIDAYIDAQSGRIYNFYVRSESVWSDMDPDQMAEAWGSYLGLTGKEIYDSVNPLLETTPNFVKYRFPGMEEESTIVTIGFYEGINELFLKSV